MTDGERLVWATSYALVFDRSGDAVQASRSAAFAVEELRATAVCKRLGSDRTLTPSIERVERDLLDEIVNVP